MQKVLINIVVILSSFSTLNSQPKVWNIESLSAAKSITSEAKKHIIQEADKVLTKKISSVIEKKIMPPSGDIHDYISCGPYWWPDPTKPNAPYIRKDGESNANVLTPDKINLSIMAKGIIRLSMAYFFTDDEKYARKAVENLKIWFIDPETKMNPNLNFGQTIFGRNDGKGRGAGMIETYTFVEMLDGIELLKKSSSFKKTGEVELKKWFSEYLNWMMTSDVGNQEYKAKNNHGVAFDVLATRIALFLDKKDIAQKYITEFPVRRIFAHIEPDGSQPLELARTRALHYSTFNLAHMLDMCCIAKTENVYLFDLKSTDNRSIPKAFDFLSQYTGKEQSQFPYQQITDWEVAQSYLILQLYRADKMGKGSKYKMFYKDRLSVNNKNDMLFIY